MSHNMWPPVTFESTADIMVNSNGQLQSMHSGIEEWQQKYRGKESNCNVFAVADGIINGNGDEHHTGLTFDLTSCASGFSKMSVGLARKQDGSALMDFSICLDGDEIFLHTICVVELGRIAYKMSCEGNERVTIRLDDAGSHVEYLVNDELVYTSERTVHFPLCCKVMNVVNRNIQQRSYTNNPPQTFSMRLPARNLKWSKTVLKVLTLRVVGLESHGIVETSCTSLSGNEFARLETQVGQSIGHFKEALLRQTNGDLKYVILVSEDGNVLADTNKWPLLEHKPPLATAGHDAA